VPDSPTYRASMTWNSPGGAAQTAIARLFRSRGPDAVNRIAAAGEDGRQWQAVDEQHQAFFDVNHPSGSESWPT